MEEMILATHGEYAGIPDRFEWWSRQTTALLLHVRGALASSSLTRQVHHLQHGSFYADKMHEQPQVDDMESTSVRAWSHGNDMRRHGVHGDGLEMRPAAARRPCSQRRRSHAASGDTAKE
jgi:hypothetical protein